MTTARWPFFGMEAFLERAIWIHQFSQLSEQTPQEIADTLLPRGISAIYPKVMDGMNWMGDFYRHPLAPTDMASWGRTLNAFNDVGLSVVGWVVPRWTAAEADFHLSLSEFIVDFEYQYVGFWQGTDAQAWDYFNKLREAVQDGHNIGVAPDPRQPSRDYGQDLIAGLSAYLPQTYWTDFQRSAIHVLNAARWNMSSLEPFLPILPYNSTPEDMEAALGWCVEQECAGVSLWRMGTANDAQLDAFAQRVPGEPGQEEPDVDDTERKRYQDQIDGLVNAFGYLTGDAMQPLTRTSAAKYVKTYVAEARRVADQVGVNHA